MTLSDFRYFRDNPDARRAVERIELGIEDETKLCPECGGKCTVMVSDTPWGMERPQPCYECDGTGEVRA